MWCGVLAVVAAAALTAVAAARDAPCVALAPVPSVQLSRRRNARRGEHPYLALVATTWGECSAAIIAPIALLGASSCMPRGYLHNGRAEAGNSRFFTAQDFGDKPTQAKIIDKFITIGTETQFADSLILIKLLDPFEFTPYVTSIPMSPPVSLPVRALVVGYGMGSNRRARRQQTTVEVLLGPCCKQPPREDAACVIRASRDCRPDHGAPIVREGNLVAIASNESLCTGTVLLVPPLRERIKQEVTILEVGERRSLRGCGPGGLDRNCMSSAGPRSHGLSLLMRWCVAILPALIAWALS